MPETEEVETVSEESEVEPAEVETTEADGGGVVTSPSDKTTESLSKAFPADEDEEAEGAEPPPASEAIVPAAYRRSLKAYQWTDEEIDNAARANPANFLATAAKLHESRNAQTREMSELGRRLKEQQKAAEAGKESVLPTKFDPLDIAALKKTYGENEPFIRQLEGLNKVVEFANTVMPWMQASQARQQAAELDALSRQIDGYFGSKDLEAYSDVYGKRGAQLDDKQLTARQQVLDTAELVLSGARQLGRTLTLEDALTIAHDAVSGPVREGKAREKIVKEVKSRQAALSLRPGGRVTASPQDGKALQTKVKAGLAAVFGQS